MSAFTEIEEALGELKHQARIQRGASVTLVLEGRSYDLKIFQISQGVYQAMVFNTCYGEAKTIRGAVGAIKRRLHFLQNYQEVKPDHDRIEADRIYLELERRKKNGGWA